MTREELEKAMLSSYLRVLNRDSVPTRAEAKLITALAEPAWAEITRLKSRKRSAHALPTVTVETNPADPALEKLLSDNRDRYIQQSSETKYGIVPDIYKPEDK